MQQSVLFCFQNKESEKLSETSKMLMSMAKENIPPNSQQNYPSGIVFFFICLLDLSSI